MGTSWRCVGAARLLPRPGTAHKRKSIYRAKRFCELAIRDRRQGTPALDVSVLKLRGQPDLGRLRHFRHPELRLLRSLRVEAPSDKLFCRVESGVPNLIRRPRRLIEPPESLPD